MRYRHWKQRFDPKATFVWRRGSIWNGQPIKIGDVVPKDLSDNKRRLRIFWNSRYIELKGFVNPSVLTGHPMEDQPVDTTQAEPIAEPSNENVTPAPAAWQSLTFREQVALARQKGYKGNMPKREVLDAFLTQHAA